MIPKNRQLHIDFRISRPDGFTWTENLASYLTRAEIALGSIESVGTESAGVDVGVRTMRFTLKNDAESFSPRDQDSAWNRHNDTYAPLLWPYREVIYKIAFTEIGATPQESDWETRFHGFLGDMIQVQENGRIVTCECRDLSKLLQDTYIESPQKYGSDQGIPAETVIQQIIDTNLGAGMVGLYCPESPGKAITEYNVEYLSVWDAIQNIAKQIGWFLGYRWNEDIGAFKLTLLEPPREKTTPDHQLDHNDDIYVQDLDVSDRDIRNAVTVTYRNKDTGQRESVTVIDQQSIYAYRRRAMQIEEDNASLIDTEAEALTLANAALADLKGLSGTTRIEMPILPTMDLFSTIQVYNPRVSSTYDFYAVESLRETYDFGQRPRFRMEAICSGRVIGGHTKWLAMQTRPGSPGQPAYPITQIPPADFRWDTCEFVRDVHLRWHPVRGAKQYEIRLDENWGSADNIIYRGDALEFRFAPIQRAYTFYGAAIDEAGNYSQAVSVTISNSTPKTPPQPIITEFFSSLWIEILPVPDNDILGYNLYMTPCDAQGNPTGDTEISTYPYAQRVTYYAQPKQSYLIEISAFDVIGEGPKSSPVQATIRQIDDIAQFAQEIIPPRVVDVLPTLPDPDYPEGCLVVLTTDHKLYRSTGAEWTADIETADLAGQIVAEQIAEEAIQAVHIAEHAVESAKLAIGAVTADILAANAVTETKISDNAISTPKIQTSAVTAEKVAAEAITTEKLNALAVTADKIAANAITAAKIAAGAIGVEQLAAQAVTTEKLAAGSIEAYIAAVQEAFIDSAKIISIEADKIKVGGSSAPIPLAIQPGDILFRFDNSLLSTQGLKPIGME